MKHLTRISNAGFLCLACVACVACDDEDDSGAGAGTVQVTAYGESFIEDGIPASEMGDGWAVTFETFEVDLANITVAGTDLGGGTVELATGSDGAGHPVASAAVAAGGYTGPAYDVTGVSVKGSATKDGETLTFDWRLDAPTRYADCETTTDVPADGTGTFQITIHADHLFYDSLVSEDPGVVFQALADADTDGDGAITQAELAATDIGSYDVGNADVQDLWGWLIAQTRTLGHVDGEGHCDAEAL